MAKAIENLQTRIRPEVLQIQMNVGRVKQIAVILHRFQDGITHKLFSGTTFCHPTKT